MTKTLGPVKPASTQPESLAVSGLHATINPTGYASDGRSKSLSLTSTFGKNVPWTHFTHGVTRKASFGARRSP